MRHCLSFLCCKVLDVKQLVECLAFVRGAHTEMALGAVKHILFPSSSFSFFLPPSSFILFLILPSSIFVRLHLFFCTWVLSLYCSLSSCWRFYFMLFATFFSYFVVSSSLISFSLTHSLSLSLSTLSAIDASPPFTPSPLCLWSLSGRRQRRSTSRHRLHTFFTPCVSFFSPLLFKKLSFSFSLFRPFTRPFYSFLFFFFFGITFFATIVAEIMSKYPQVFHISTFCRM